MGLFDRVMVQCPSCGEKTEFQSKAGSCNMDTFDLTDAPHTILLDLDRDREFCDCGKLLEIRVQVVATVV